jgi:4-amino-4-deoxy-L-arabinose transferase-like glycosyltransferase
VKHRPEWWWVALWGVLVAVALTLRPLLPIDETRYLSVAWEMWLRQDWLVPHLNGSPYPDKPPLLFWGILLGWRVFGVNEWWPRLLPPLAALLCLFLLANLARRLSPDGLAARTVLFMSGLLWVLYSTLVLFDTLLTACVLLALVGVADAASGRPIRGWIAYGMGVGLGVLAKGPVVLVHVLPVALLAPWWSFTAPVRRRRWYLGLVAAVALGAAIGFAWALPAGARGGQAYREALLWKEGAGRIANAFAHRRPWWWYLPLLPLLLFPWALWPSLWRSFAELRRGPPQVATRFALSCLVPGLIVFSLISGKQVHYLMPLLPVFAILAGTAIATRPRPISLSLVSPALLIVAHLAAAGPLAWRYDLRPAAAEAKDAERAGRPVAYVGGYEGQLHFLGRLERPLEEVKLADVGRWRAAHPGGLVLLRKTPASSTPPSLPFRPKRPAAGD